VEGIKFKSKALKIYKKTYDNGKVSIEQEEITILNKYALIIGVPKYIYQI
jgi:hypothetical protein